MSQEPYGADVGPIYSLEANPAEPSHSRLVSMTVYAGSSESTELARDYGIRYAPLPWK